MYGEEEKTFETELAARQGRRAQDPASTDERGASVAAPDGADTATTPDEPERGPDLADGSSEDEGAVPTEGEAADTPAASPDPPPSDSLPVPAEVVAGDPSAPYRAMDRADEVQIIEEIEGRMSEVLVYKIPSGSDLSFAGVREAVRLLVERTGRQIRVGSTPPVRDDYTEDGQKFVRVTVYAEDVASGQGYWGTAEQPARMKLKSETAKRYRRQGKYVGDDDTVRDEFAFTKALSKAQRNALKYFIPEQIRQAVLAIAKNDPKRLREITVGIGAPADDLPKPLATDQAKWAIKECRDLYKKICDLDPDFKRNKPPGQFHAALQAAWSNQDALNSLRDSLAELFMKKRDGDQEAMQV